jgi:hypothetical protein
LSSMRAGLGSASTGHVQDFRTTGTIVLAPSVVPKEKVRGPHLDLRPVAVISAGACRVTSRLCRSHVAARPASVLPGHRGSRVTRDAGPSPG